MQLQQFVFRKLATVFVEVFVTFIIPCRTRISDQYLQEYYVRCEGTVIDDALVRF